MRWLLDTPAPIALAAGLYVLQGCAYWRRGDPGHAIAWWSYAGANVGFLIAWYR